MNFDELKIAIDLDDTIFNFILAFNKRFPKCNWEDENSITKKVRKLEYDKEFWSNLPLLEKPNGFEPHIYSTKRINSKKYTRACLEKYNLPIKPIYQTRSQTGNKANIIKGRCDLLIDDSIRNVVKCIQSGIPALLINRPHNLKANFPFRISSLNIVEIKSALKCELKAIESGWRF